MVLLRTVGGAIILCLAASFPTIVQTASAQDAQATTSLRQSLAALTGPNVVSDVTLTGTAHRVAGSDDESGTATLEATSAGDSRVELSFSSGNQIEIRNHSSSSLPDAVPPGVTIPSAAAQAQPVGAWSGSDGVLHGMARHNTMTEASWFFPAIAVADFARSPLWVATYVGTEIHNGLSVVHLQLAQVIPSSVNAPRLVVGVVQRLTRTDLYLDSGSLLPVALDFNTHPTNDAYSDISVEIRFSQYQSVNGVEVPMHVEKYLNNGLVLDLQFTSVTLNSGLSTSRFALQQ